MEPLASKSFASPLKCASCYAPLQTSPNNKDPRGTFLVCKYCGATTRFDEARTWADQVNQWLERRFGERGGEVLDGGADVTLRSYVFQKDIVDYLASRFLVTAKFLNPVLSSPDSSSPPALRDELEFGLELSEYLDGIALDTTLPDHPEIRSLAGTPVDLQEANRQSFKLRAITYFARGLVNLQKGADLNLAGAAAPAAIKEFENAEVSFEGSLKACREGRQSFPEDSFFVSFGSFALGSNLYVKGIRLHGKGFTFDASLDEAQAAFQSIAEAGRIKLDQSRRSAVFVDPSKAKVRGKVEARLSQATSSNLNRVSRYQEEARSFPDQIQLVSNRVRAIMMQFLTSQNRSFYLALLFLGGLFSLLITAASAIASPRAFFAYFPSGGFLILVLDGGITLVFGLLLKAERDKRELLLSQYRGVARTMANPLFGRISLLCLHCSSVVNYYLQPWEFLHELFYGKIVKLNWILHHRLIVPLIQEVQAVGPTPDPFDRMAPDAFVRPKKDRSPEDYQKYEGVTPIRSQLSFPFLA